MDESKIRAERIAAKLRRKQRMVRVARGEEQADLVLKNATFVNVFTDSLEQGDIAVCNGLVAGVGVYHGAKEVDVSGRIVAPGFIDAHIHLESSLVTPPNFARAVLPHGTTTVVCDPHEIANVCGAEGVEYMMAASAGLPLDVHFMLPSCVPALPFEENGATLSWRDIHCLFDHPMVLGLAEMMNYPGILAGDRTPIEKIIVSQAHHKKIDGHAPGLSGLDLNAYMACGVYSDHECDTVENAMEKLRKGQFIMIREGTAAQNLQPLMPLLKWPYAARCMFCTDDKHPADLLEKGHIDYICRRAVALGADPILTVKVASHHAARYFLLNNKGAVAPGYLADFTVLDDLRSFRVRQVFKRGQLVFDGGQVVMEEPEVDPDILSRVSHSFHMPPVTPEALRCEGETPVIGMVDGSIVTRDMGRCSRMDPAGGILKMAVAERYRETGHVRCCYVHNYGLRRGAVATSVAHDSHNLIGCGADDRDLAAAMNTVRDMRGGMAVALDGRVEAALPLPMGGLMTDRPLTEVNTCLEACKRQAWAQGVQPGVDPFMTLSFMSLPVIPTLRLTTRGVFDVNRFEFIG